MYVIDRKKSLDLNIFKGLFKLVQEKISPQLITKRENMTTLINMLSNNAAAYLYSILFIIAMDDKGYREFSLLEGGKRGTKAGASRKVNTHS